MERRLAPHVDQRWAETFIVELRLVDVTGARIGEALSEVESHCGESGQGADQAFGDPVAYARTLPVITADTPALAASYAPCQQSLCRSSGCSS